MQKLLLPFTGLLLLATLLLQTACCPDCAFDQSDYVGTYHIVESCSWSPPGDYTVTILEGATGKEVKLLNFLDIFKGAVNATIDCETITIPHQEPDGDKYFVEGSGVIKRENGQITIVWNYSLRDENVTPHITEPCAATIYSKQ
jgi:hypothetical protein